MNLYLLEGSTLNLISSEAVLKVQTYVYMRNIHGHCNALYFRSLALKSRPGFYPQELTCCTLLLWSAATVPFIPQKSLCTPTHEQCIWSTLYTV